MRLRLCILATAFAHALTGPLARAQAVGGYGDYVDWEGWARVASDQRGALVSSWDRTGGNLDFNQYQSPSGFQSGSLPTVAGTLRGPGIVYRFWMPHKNALDRYAVRMFFDGETTPRIDTDSKVLLGGSYGYFDPPLVNTFAGGQTSYEPIPFRDSVRIETQNRSGKNNYYQYSARRFPSGTTISSYTGLLDGPAQSARNSLVAMFQNLGQHPAGPSGTALQDGIGPTSLPPGASVAVADLTGPGLIRRLSVRMDGATDAELDSLLLRISYDASQPAIDCPIGWFFGAGHGHPAYKSLPLGTNSPDGFYCYWPMPFHGGVRVELVNASVTPIALDGAVVEHETQAIAADAGYLHAEARSVTHVAERLSHVMVAATGAGHYVGNLLYVQQNAADQSYLQGDALIVADGVDSLRGTGLEDEYNGGHYYNWGSPISSEPEGASPHSAIRPLTGLLAMELTSAPPFSRADQYRWMIGDRVPFAQSLDVQIEARYAVVGARWTSVAFWYQLPPNTLGVPPRAVLASRRLELRPIAPHPVVNEAEIRFWLAVDEDVTVELLDVSGRRVQTVVNERLVAGSHGVRWSRGSLTSGIYFLHLRAGGQVVSRKIVLTP